MDLFNNIFGTNSMMSSFFSNITHGNTNNGNFQFSGNDFANFGGYSNVNMNQNMNSGYTFHVDHNGQVEDAYEEDNEEDEEYMKRYIEIRDFVVRKLPRYKYQKYLKSKPKNPQEYVLNFNCNLVLVRFV